MVIVIVLGVAYTRVIRKFKSALELFGIIGMDSPINECYHAWSEISQSGKCGTASDCNDPNADCVFSIIKNEHICCGPKKDAVMPSKRC